MKLIVLEKILNCSVENVYLKRNLNMILSLTLALSDKNSKKCTLRLAIAWTGSITNVV